MGRIVTVQGEQGHELGFITTIGRSQSCNIVVPRERAKVSSMHAQLRWTPRGWCVRDLGSTNGTWVNNQRVEGTLRLAQGDRLRFGDDNEWWLIDASQPHAVATSDAGHVRTGASLELPDDTPIYGVACDPTDGWELHDLRTGQRTVIKDGHEIEVEGTRWTLALPAPAVTLTLGNDAPVMGRMHLRFEVEEGEPRALEVRFPTGRIKRLDCRARHRLLLRLAEERIYDQTRSLDPNPEAQPNVGWMRRTTLEGYLGITRGNFNVMSFKARSDMERLGVRNPKALIERRQTDGDFEYRIGTGLLEIDD